ncbi:hypothetical protein BN1221_02615 [Brenneria goodwinii]|uniref:Uncharacterized protein n=1 Tax=Brenneria goodwinii TaxID=1109412 RepID=A0A0G4JW71_9GAMM|nr:hypothetical protein BN1221_02615 [Brenneria goodwinii]
MSERHTWWYAASVVGDIILINAGSAVRIVDEIGSFMKSDRL